MHANVCGKFGQECSSTVFIIFTHTTTYKKSRKMAKKHADKYQVINGVSYKKEAHGEVIKVLEEARASGTRLSIVYGDCKTGKPWGKEIYGYIGKGTTTDHLPVLLASKRSGGGACIMDASILEIKDARTNKILYKWEMDKSLIIEEKLEDITHQLSREPIERFCEA